ncbi:cellulose biosynthesis cyclic di-GMP-binding regulatory protein BcsB [Hylemonella sp. W303a]|uniref:cellulose biosynthesis cyclic di-GMP-binding regulatory protein BcsB n=1 Tax=Hylemonella sp. W303a TaxID=3389873 RepID=UPI00396AF3E6
MNRQPFNYSPTRGRAAALTLIAALSSLISGPAWPKKVQPSTSTASANTANAPAASNPTASPLPTRVRRLNLGQLGNQTAFQLRTTEGRTDINFGLRADELVTQAVLRLRYAYSPALIPGQSHIKVLLNDELMATLPLTANNAGQPVTQDVTIDPRFIVDFNRLTLQFIGHYAQNCELSGHSSLWADVSGASELELTVRPIELRNDLARLPEPFFDPRDLGRLNLPFVFAAQPSPDTLRAAGITASWFGQLAAWRGARFTAHLDGVDGTLPPGHALVFATNSERPDWMAQTPPFTGPSLSMLSNPGDGASRLLLVSGRDGADLRVAADALVRGAVALSGSHVAVQAGPAAPARAPYDAPRWVRMDRPTTFGELVQTPEQLQAAGRQTDSIRVDLRIPPDLYAWKSRGVPVDLKFRYTPPVRAGESRMTMSLNQSLVQAFNLRASEPGRGEEQSWTLPLMDKGLAVERERVVLSPFQLAPRSQLQYAYSFATHRGADCENPAVDNARGAVDPDSTIDFSGYPHYAELPQLSHFASLGFPFTRYADLSQTAVVLPEQPGRDEIETLLTLLGRMGESTGYPATQVAVVGPRQVDTVRDRDLLLIGTAPGQTLLQTWKDHLPAVVDGTQRGVSQPARASTALFGGFGLPREAAAVTQERIEATGPLVALLGFESPLASGRSVVAVTAGEPRDLPKVLDALDTQAGVMHGSVVFVRSLKDPLSGRDTLKVDSIAVGPTYTTGVLPFWTVIAHGLRQHPTLLGLLWFGLAVLGLVLVWKLWLAVRHRRGRGRA